MRKEQTVDESPFIDNEHNKTPLIVICPNIKEAKDTLYNFFGHGINEIICHDLYYVDLYIKDMKKCIKSQKRVVLFPIDLSNSIEVKNAEFVIRIGGSVVYTYYNTDHVFRDKGFNDDTLVNISKNVETLAYSMLERSFDGVDKKLLPLIPDSYPLYLLKPLREKLEM